MEFFPTQEISLILSTLVLLGATAMVVLVHGSHELHGPLRLATIVIWIMAALRMYSASSFIWGPEASDIGLIPFLRVTVIAALTIELIVLLALTGYYWNRWARA